MSHVTFLSVHILIAVITCVNTARILGVFPIPSISHQVVFRPFTQELARRGHEMVIITPSPALEKRKPPANLTEIDVGFSYEYVRKEYDKIQRRLLKKGVIAGVDEHTLEVFGSYLKVMIEQIKSPEVKKLLEDKNQKFDLVIVEAFFQIPLVYGYIFNAPVIQFSSFHGTPENYETVGALRSHVLHYPNFMRNKFRDLTFWDKLWQIYYELKLKYEFWKIENEESRLLKEHFGSKTPSIAELKNNVAMLFLNTHPLFEDNRSVPPNVKYLGALHLQPSKPIPENLKQYLDNSKTGVIYVSLGSNVLPSKMDKDLLNAFIEAFRALPYDILWKFDDVNLEGVPNNVKIQKWFPQRDMLFHPNIRVFVTQGGLQSTDETIDAGVPVVGIPMLGDQWYNVNKYVELGIGLQLDAMRLQADHIVKAVKTIVEDRRFNENIQRLKTIINDQPETPLSRAVWWVEHILRHKGAKHLRAPTANVSWADYFMLDVVGFIFITYIVLVFVVCFALSTILKMIIKRFFSVTATKRKNN